MCDSSLSAGGVSAMDSVRPLTGGGVGLQQQQQQQQQHVHKEEVEEDPDAKEAALIERISSASELMRKHLADIKACDETLQSLIGAIEQGGDISEEMRRKGLELADRKVDLADQGYKAIDSVICELDVELGRLEAALREDHFSLEEVAAVKRRRLKEIERKMEQERKEIEMALTERSEPLYCICRSVSFGDMVACDNENCAIEWFHFSCVNLKETPKGAWYCPACRAAMEAARPKRKRKRSVYSSRRKKRTSTS